MRGSRPLVYVAGPLMSFFKGTTQATNVRAGTMAALSLMKAGVDAFCPHMSWFADLFEDDPPEYERWISLDFNMIARCDALLRLDGKSPGADREVTLAQTLNLPIFYSIEQVVNWAKAQV